MFEQYVKLFHLNWIEHWMVEAVFMILGGVILGLIVCKAIECFNGDEK